MPQSPLLKGARTALLCAGMHTKEIREYEKLCAPVFALLFSQDAEGFNNL